MPNKIKVMIIEDEDAISNFIATTLKANSYAPLLARTGSEALSMIPSHCPDIFITFSKRKWHYSKFNASSNQQCCHLTG